MAEESKIHYVKATVTFDEMLCGYNCDHLTEDSQHMCGFCTVHKEFCPVVVVGAKHRYRRCGSCISGKTKEDLLKELQNG